MAKVDGLHQQPRAPALRGALTIQPTRAGLVAKAWPKKRGKRLSPKQAEAIERFKEAAIICKYAPSADQLQSRKLARGSQFLPRDLQYMAIYGRLATLFFTNGERRYQMASKVDITELLDVLGFAPGTILFRGKDYWEALEPGREGEALIIQDGLPAWGEGGGGGNGGAGPINVLTRDIAVTSNGYASRGQIVVPQRDFLCSGFGAILRGFSPSAGPYTMTLAKLSDDTPSATITEIVAVSDPYTVIGASDNWHEVLFGSNVPMTAGQPYLLGLSQFTSSPTAISRVFFPNTPRNAVWCAAPASYIGFGMDYRSLDFTVSQAADNVYNAIYIIAPLAVAP